MIACLPEVYNKAPILRWKVTNTRQHKFAGSSAVLKKGNLVLRGIFEYSGS